MVETDTLLIGAALAGLWFVFGRGNGSNSSNDGGNTSVPNGPWRELGWRDPTFTGAESLADQVRAL